MFRAYRVIHPSWDGKYLVHNPPTPHRSPVCCSHPSMPPPPPLSLEISSEFCLIWGSCSLYPSIQVDGEMKSFYICNWMLSPDFVGRETEAPRGEMTFPMSLTGQVGSKPLATSYVGLGSGQLSGTPISALRALRLLCAPSTDGPCVPVPPPEGHTGADTAGCAPRSPGFPSAEELGIPQQWWGSVSTWPGCKEEAVLLVSPPPRGAPCRQCCRDREPSDPITTLGDWLHCPPPAHLHPNGSPGVLPESWSRSAAGAICGGGF